MQDGTENNAGSNEAKHPPGRTPATGTDSGDAQPPGGGTGNRGLGGIGTAGGKNAAADPPREGKSGSTPAAEGDPNDLGTAGDYSR